MLKGDQSNGRGGWSEIVLLGDEIGVSIDVTVVVLVMVLVLSSSSGHVLLLVHGDANNADQAGLVVGTGVKHC